MAKKTVEVEKEEFSLPVAKVNTFESQVEVVSSRRIELKQKIDDALNGKTIIDNNDLREVLQYL